MTDIYDLITNLRKIKLTDKQKSIMTAGFCDPMIFADYFEDVCMSSDIDNDPRFFKRLSGMVLWANVLTNIDKLTDEELLEARKSLSHGFVQMSSNRKIKSMLTRIGEDFDFMGALMKFAEEN